MLAVNASDLNIVLICDFLECFHVLRELWQFDVDRSPHSCAQVGRTRRYVAQMTIVREFYNSLNVLGCPRNSVKNSMDIRTLLHRDDPKLVLFIHPDKESLQVVVENSSSAGPIPVQPTCLQKAVALSVPKLALLIKEKLSLT